MPRQPTSSRFGMIVRLPGDLMWGAARLALRLVGLAVALVGFVLPMLLWSGPLLFAGSAYHAFTAFDPTEWLLVPALAAPAAVLLAWSALDSNPRRGSVGVTLAIWWALAAPWILPWTTGADATTALATGVLAAASAAVTFIVAVGFADRASRR